MNTSSFFILIGDLPLGLQVRALRPKFGWRQSELAQRASVTQGDVSALECGQKVVPTRRRRILEALGAVESSYDAR